MFTLLLSLASCDRDGTGTKEPPPAPTEKQTLEPAQKTSPELTPEPPPEPTPEPTLQPTPNPVADALAQYRVIALLAASFNYGLDDPDATYHYALVRMQNDHEISALLLEKVCPYYGINTALVFQYEPDSGQVIRDEGNLTEGIASVGGFRGSLSAAGNGNGILSTEFSSGTGEGSTSRITLNGTSLQFDTFWEGNIFDNTDRTGDEIGFSEIDWYDIADLSALNS